MVLNDTPEDMKTKIYSLVTATRGSNIKYMKLLVSSDLL